MELFPQPARLESLVSGAGPGRRQVPRDAAASTLVRNDPSARLVTDPVTYFEQPYIERRRIESQHFP